MTAVSAVAATAMATAPGMATGRSMSLSVIEGEFEDACEVCAVRPTAVLVRVVEEDCEAAPKAGDGVRRETVRDRYFCAEHIGAADELRSSYREDPRVAYCLVTQ
jgi:hypothetical protein